jgi:hypothetical protein
MAHAVAVHHHHHHHTKQPHVENGEDGEGPAWGGAVSVNTFKQENLANIVIPEKMRKKVKMVRHHVPQAHSHARIAPAQHAELTRNRALADRPPRSRSNGPFGVASLTVPAFGCTAR